MVLYDCFYYCPKKLARDQLLAGKGCNLHSPCTLIGVEIITAYQKIDY